MIGRLKQLLRLANAMALTLYRVVIGPLAFAVSHLRRRDRAVMVWQNTDRALDIGVALFVHFDAGGVVRGKIVIDPGQVQGLADGQGQGGRGRRDFARPDQDGQSVHRPKGGIPPGLRPGE